MLTREAISLEYQKIQDEICAELERIDGKAVFIEDQWQREGGGGGRSRVIRQGDVLEKGGVNFSAVHGAIPDPLKKEFGESASFYATGVSIVLHPQNPFVPVIHMNIRYFETDSGVYWFGGGIDLTPHYVRPEQARLFHGRLKEVCDRFEASFYRKFKSWADDYFFIPHRNETRGVGGIFFDHLNNSTGLDKEQLFAFSCAVGRTFLACYEEQVALNRALAYTSEQKQWQLLRRGRYVEFNLVYDRGTRFGLETNGRTESILMSLPEQASWFYNHIPEAGSAEAETLSYLKKGIEWV